MKIELELMPDLATGVGGLLIGFVSAELFVKSCEIEFISDFDLESFELFDIEEHDVTIMGWLFESLGSERFSAGELGPIWNEIIYKEII